MICPTCGSKATNIRTAIHNGAVITNCEHCSKLQQAHPLAARNRREQQKKDFRGDLLQPGDGRDYARKYPEQARKLWGDETYRQLS